MLISNSRMAIGGMNRTHRVFPYDDVEVCGWTVPKEVSLREGIGRKEDSADCPSPDPNVNVHLLDAQRSRRLSPPGGLRTNPMDRRRSRASEGHASVLCSFRQRKQELCRTEVSSPWSTRQTARWDADSHYNSLVYMQLFHTLARIFRAGSPTYDLHDTTLRDVVANHGLLFPLPPLDSKRVQVKIS
jgi:hypothetical protein